MLWQSQLKLYPLGGDLRNLYWRLLPLW